MIGEVPLGGTLEKRMPRMAPRRGTDRVAAAAGATLI
jgi:hypothetical protein